MWTLSGSCPLCLTPPCYHLEPPATAAPFLSQYGSKPPRHRGTFNSHGNYIAKLTIPVSGQIQPARPCLLNRIRSVCLSRVSERGRYVRKIVERVSAGVIRRAARRFTGLLRLVP